MLVKTSGTKQARRAAVASSTAKQMQFETDADEEKDDSTPPTAADAVDAYIV